MQEIDLPAGYDENFLTFKGYSLITENNNVKQRTGIYIQNGINYIRRSELEGQNNGLIIICNRLTILNRQVNLDWLNLSLTAFKLKTKNAFVTNG